MHQNRRDNLRVLIAQQLGHRDGVHPFQAFNARDIAALQDAIKQQRSLIVPQGAAQHRFDVIAGIFHQQALRGAIVGKPRHHKIDFLFGHPPHAGDGFAQFLHFFGREVLKHLGRLFLAQGHEQDCSIIQTTVIHSHYSLR